MSAMLRREFLICLPYNIMFLILVPFLYLITANMSGFPIIFGFIIGFFAALFYYEQQYGVNKFLVSLPVSRKTIINARYVYSLILVPSIHLYIFFIDFLANTFLPYYKGEALTVQTIFFYFCATMMIMAIFLPVYFQFKYMTAFFIQMASIIIIPAVTFWGMNHLLTESNFFKVYVNHWLDVLIEIYTSNPVLILIIVTGLLYSISWLISQWIFSKKEFS